MRPADKRLDAMPACWRVVRIFPKLTVLVAALAALATPAHATDTLELKFSTFVPATNGIVVDVLQPLGKEIERKSGGNVKVRVFAGDSPLGKVEKQADQVKRSLVDLAFGMIGIRRGRFLRTSIMELPFVAESGELASRTLWTMSRGALAADWKDFKLAALTCENPSPIHFRGRRIGTITGVNGLRMFASDVPTLDLLAYLGATPVAVAPNRLHESLEKGALDGAVLPWNAVAEYHLERLLKYHLDARVDATCYYLVMNPRRFAAYPLEVRKAIDSSIGAPLVDKLSELWDRWDKVGRNAAIKAGGVMVPVSGATRKKWRAELKSVIDQQLVKLRNGGVPNARAIYDEMLRTEARLAIQGEQK